MWLEDNLDHNDSIIFKDILPILIQVGMPAFQDKRVAQRKRIACLPSRFELIMLARNCTVLMKYY